MSSLSTFGTFTMARLGIWVSQQALNVTGNNISNVNTDGYSRQQIDLYNISATGADRYQSKFDIRVSGGAVVNSISQMRDQYLDIRYRDEQSSVGAMDARLDGLNQLATIFDEVGRGDDSEGLIEAAFEYMVQQVETLSAQGAGMDEFDSMFRASASSFVELVRNRAGQLERLSENMTKGFEQDVNTVNSLMERIRDLNVSIRKSQVYGGDALEQQDERNNLIDELSEYLKIDVQYVPEHLGENLYVDKLVIRTGGVPSRTLVDGIYATELSIRQVQDTDEDGNLLFDNNGDPVMVDSPNFDLDMSELKDAYGRTNPVKTDLGPVVVSDTPVITPTAGNTTSDRDSSTGFASEAEANALASRLNGDAAFYQSADGSKTYYYHVNEENGQWYIHQHDVTGRADRLDYAGSSYTYTNISYDYDSEAAGANTPTSYASEAAAQNIASQLPLDGVDEDGNEYTYAYSVVSTGAGYQIHKTQTSYGAAQLTDTELYGALQSEREILTEKGVYATAEDKERDTNAATKRGIPFYQKALDTLANTFADLMNKANMLNDIQGYDANGVPIYNDDSVRIYEYEKDGGGNYVLDANGYRKALIDKDGYYELTDYAKDKGYESGGVLFSNDGNDNKTDRITAANISISKSWANGSFRVLSSVKPDAASRENDNLNRILHILTDEHEYLPNMGDLGNTAASDQVYFTGSFQELLTTHMAGTLATDQRNTQTMLDNYNVTADELFVNRDSVMGVDLNDEAVNMMMYQKSYAAACRLMTTYDEMLERLLGV